MPGDEIEVHPKRLHRARLLLVENSPKIEEDEVLRILYELEWHDNVYYSEEGRLQFQLTDLQQVGLAAAFAAYLETRDG